MHVWVPLIYVYIFVRVIIQIRKSKITENIHAWSESVCPLSLKFQRRWIFLSRNTGFKILYHVIYIYIYTNIYIHKKKREISTDIYCIVWNINSFYSKLNRNSKISITLIWLNIVCGFERFISYLTIFNSHYSHFDVKQIQFG